MVMSTNPTTNAYFNARFTTEGWKANCSVSFMEGKCQRQEHLGQDRANVLQTSVKLKRWHAHRSTRKGEVTLTAPFENNPEGQLERHENRTCHERRRPEASRRNTNKLQVTRCGRG